MFNKEIARRVHGCMGCPNAKGDLECSKKGKIDFLDAAFCPIGRWVKVYVMGMSTVHWDAKEKTLWIEREDRIIEKKLDAAFQRNGHLCWAAENGTLADEEREMQVRFDEKTRTLWLPKANQALETQLDAKYERMPGLLRWKVPEDGFNIDRGIDFMAAKLSGKLEVDDPIVAVRSTSCNGCEALKRDPHGSWCIPCGCGNKNLMLNVDGTPGAKMLFRNLNCPRFQPGFSNS